MFTEKIKRSTLSQRIWFLLVLLALGFAITAYALRPSAAEIGKSSHSRKTPAERVDAIRQALDTHTGAFIERNRRILDEFNNDIRHAGLREYNLAKQGVEPFVKDCSSAKFYKDMCINLVKDWKNETNTASADMEGKLRHYVLGHLTASDAEVINAYENFKMKIQESDNQYRAAIADLREVNSDLEKFDSFRKLFESQEKIMATLKGNALHAAFTTAGVAVEAACIKTTVKCVVKLCAGVARGIARKSAASTFLALIDGPLPFGDILAAASLAWCAKDIYDLTVKVPRELRATVNRAIEENRANLLSEVTDKARKLVSECEQSALQIKREALQ